MIFRLFRDPSLEQFAREAVQSLAARIPPATVDVERSAKENAKFEKRLGNALGELFVAVKDYSRKNEIGVLKRARVTKSIQDELRKLGYSAEFVKQVTLALAQQMTSL